jgi:hypothetical protein
VLDLDVAPAVKLGLVGLLAQACTKHVDERVFLSLAKARARAGFPSPPILNATSKHFYSGAPRGSQKPMGACAPSSFSKLICRLLELLVAATALPLKAEGATKAEAEATVWGEGQNA